MLDSNLEGLNPLLKNEACNDTSMYPSIIVKGVGKNLRSKVKILSKAATKRL